MARAINCEPVDVVVVGAGFGGAAFCKRLSERMPSLRIVCLERGGWVDPATMPAYRRDWQRAVLSQWATSPNLRLKAVPPSSSADYPVDDTCAFRKFDLPRKPRRFSAKDVAAETPNLYVGWSTPVAIA